jgi:hypothetical protein
MNVWVMTSEKNLQVSRTLALRILASGENVNDGSLSIKSKQTKWD